MQLDTNDHIILTDCTCGYNGGRGCLVPCTREKAEKVERGVTKADYDTFVELIPGPAALEEMTWQDLRKMLGEAQHFATRLGSMHDMHIEYRALKSKQGQEEVGYIQPTDSDRLTVLENEFRAHKEVVGKLLATPCEGVGKDRHWVPAEGNPPSEPGEHWCAEWERDHWEMFSLYFSSDGKWYLDADQDATAVGDSGAKFYYLVGLTPPEGGDACQTDT